MQECSLPSHLFYLQSRTISYICKMPIFFVKTVNVGKAWHNNLPMRAWKSGQCLYITFPKFSKNNYNSCNKSTHWVPNQYNNFLVISLLYHYCALSVFEMNPCICQESVSPKARLSCDKKFGVFFYFFFHALVFEQELSA